MTANAGRVLSLVHQTQEATMKNPATLAREIETNPTLPPGDAERFAGYGVMGLPFRSGHVLGLRRWPAASIGDAFTSVWHRNPSGRWTFYQTSEPDIACTRYFGADVERVRTGRIELSWEHDRRLCITSVDDDAVRWTVELASTAVTRAFSAVGSVMPAAAWRSGPVLSMMGGVAGLALRAGRVRLTGAVPNGQHFDANPLRIWYVADSHAVIEGEDLGPPGRLAEQAHLADFYIPQRGIFAIADAHIVAAD